MRVRIRVGATLIVTAFAACGWIGVARADDPSSDSLTVLPFSNTSVAMTAKDKRGILGIDHAFRGGTRLSFKVSAPLDEDTRVASFLKENQLIGGFNFTVHAGFDSAFRDLDLTEDERGLADLAFCNEVNASPPDKVSAGSQPTPPTPPTPPPTPADAGAPLDRAAVRDAVKEGIAASRGLIREELKAALEAEKKDKVKEIASCTPEKIEEWGKKHPDRPEWKHYTKVLSGRRHAAAVHVIPTQPGTHYALGADLSISYDRLSVYKATVSAKPTDLPKYDLQGGGSVTLYLQSQLALTLRAGGEVQKDPDPTKVDRCTSVPSDDATITGKACKSVLFLEKDEGGPKGSGYARVSIMYASLTALAGGVPGGEVRFGFEQLGQTAIFNFRATGFFSPEAGPFTGRFGIGIDLSNPLQDDSAANLSKGNIAVTPFVFIGASPTNLDSFATW